MRITFSRWPTLADAQRYLHRAQTSDRGGPLGAQVDTYRRLVQLGADEPATAAFERLYRRLLDYEIFSPRLVGRRVLPAGRITNGCTVVQRSGIGLMFLESATRVVDVWDTAEPDGSRTAGFAYVTLHGHPERGIATFEVRQEGEAVFVVLTARAVPGTMLTKVVSPLMRLIQQTITKQALRSLAANR